LRGLPSRCALALLLLKNLPNSESPISTGLQKVLNNFATTSGYLFNNYCLSKLVLSVKTLNNLLTHKELLK
jgi:hypothetical protein